MPVSHAEFFASLAKSQADDAAAHVQTDDARKATDAGYEIYLRLLREMDAHPENRREPRAATQPVSHGAAQAKTPPVVPLPAEMRDPIDTRETPPDADDLRPTLRRVAWAIRRALLSRAHGQREEFTALECAAMAHALGRALCPNDEETDMDRVFFNLEARHWPPVLTGTGKR